MIYTTAKKCWVIKTVYTAQNHDEISLFSTPSTTDWRGKSLVTLSCESPTFPELRLEGSNGIVEEGGSRKGNCIMSVTPESEWIGAIEMEKLKQTRFAAPIRDCSWGVTCDISGSWFLSLHIAYVILCFCLFSVNLHMRSWSPRLKAEYSLTNHLVSYRISNGRTLLKPLDPMCGVRKRQPKIYFITWMMLMPANEWVTSTSSSWRILRSLFVRRHRCRLRGSFHQPPHQTVSRPGSSWCALAQAQR